MTSREQQANLTAHAVAIALPVGTAVILNALSALWFLLPASIAVLALFRRRGNSSIASIALTTLLPLLGVLVIVRILIVPYSLYDTWFRLLSAGRSGGSVSHVFVWAAAYFGLLIGGSTYRFGPAPAVSAMLLSALTLAGIATTHLALFAVAGIAALSTIVLYRHADNRDVSLEELTDHDSLELASGDQEPGLWKTTGYTPLAAALLLASALLASPALMYEGGVGNSYIDRVVSPTLRQQLLTLFPRFPIQFGFGMHGYALDSGNLGGRPALSHNPVFEITALPGERIYLRTDVYDIYSGQSWQKSQRLIDTGERRDSDIHTGGPSDLNEETEALEATAVEISFLTDMYEAVPHTLTTSHVGLPDAIREGGLTGHKDSGLRFGVPPNLNEEITLYRTVGSEEAGRREHTGEYLYIPGNLPADVRQLARDLRSDQEDPRDTLRALNAWFNNGYDYTLEPDSNLREGDFVERFLFHTREGYCVQFATSFVVLARLNGIPARYVTGFLVNMPQEYYDEAVYGGRISEGERVSTQVSGLRAHAWPEVWLPGQGWTIWEATPPMRGGEVREWVGFAGASSELTRRQLEEISGGMGGDNELDNLEEELSGSGSIDRSGGRAIDTPWFRIVVAGGSAIAGTAMVLFMWKKLRPQKRPKEASGALDWELHRLVVAARNAGVDEPRRSGYRRWSEELERLLPRHVLSVRRAEHVIVTTLFASNVPTQAELRLISLLHRRVDRMHRRAAA